MNMNKSILEQLELERNKRDLIKVANEKKNTATNKPERVEGGLVPEGDQKFAWEYELERYRKERIKDKFCIAGAASGFLALFLTLLFHWEAIKSLFL